MATPSNQKHLQTAQGAVPCCLTVQCYGITLRILERPVITWIQVVEIVLSYSGSVSWMRNQGFQGEETSPRFSLLRARK